MSFYNNYTDLLNYFFSQTQDNKTPAENVFNYLCDKTTPELLQKLKREHKDFIQTTLKNMIDLYKSNIAQGKDGKEILINWKKNTPAELFGALLKTLQINEPAGIENYIYNNIALYPSDGQKPTIKTKNNGDLIIQNQIKDTASLQYWQNKGINCFCFYPAYNHLICFDLDNSDNHANKTNGIENFINFINSININQKLKNYFLDFPNNFPCYVETPNNGIHLYFHDIFLTKDIDKNFDRSKFDKLNIEIKYNAMITAGGSFRNGKEYILHGNIKNAPKLTLDLVKEMTKKRPIINYSKYDTKQNRTISTKWNLTPDGVINKAMEKYNGESPHNFIFHTGILFERAGFSIDIATSYITKTPQHIGRENKTDTYTTLKSIYNKG